ncbi:hypothetical protein LF1_51490 [Rubripirellula obstinata]|uniref:Uncharacterized protein n=1 Tax=Rubripirellula obstinata TaxID=406547 RepID=A0A5B1CQA3_9BACT|nr:hypothetical protein [Rubripirellula obstinata]KAA1262582.1 hypothetical protein LF1_51490 [Rubripirellula obstinata]
MTDTKKPIDTVRLPGGMKATTWLNTSEKGTTFTTTTITRTFKTKDGFKDSTSYSHDELLKVTKIAENAYDRITDIKASEASKSD